MLLSAGLLVAAFPLLVAERHLAATPNATNLRILALLAVLGCVALAGLNLGASFGLPFVLPAETAVTLGLAAVLAEVLVRAVGRIFLRPPPGEQRLHSFLAALLTVPFVRGARKNQMTGLDFSRSLALGYVRAAFFPLCACLLLLAWALTGVVIVPLEQRAIYERFGAPVAVLHAGLHLILPWPAGKSRAQDFATVRNIAFLATTDASQRSDTEEGDPPADADRLWTAPHPGEITLAVASQSSGVQTFQSVSADLRLLYRIGLSDAHAIEAAYSTQNPETLVRAIAGQVITGAVAGRTLAEMLGAHRETLAENWRAKIQAELDRLRTGIEMVAVVIEAIHPPAGAADSYHAVRAAEIAAQASIAAERGNASVIRAQSRQFATDRIDAARATAAEIVETARAADLRFTADREAARASPKPFLLERYFGNLSQALAGTPKTIIDHRLNWPEAPVLDLRPPQAAGSGEKGD